jgi:hypothetical protein
VYSAETLDTQVLRLKVHPAEAEEQPAPSRKAPLKSRSVPHTREMVLKLIERFKNL